MTSSDFRKQPLWFRILNKAWEAGYKMGAKVPLDKDDLIRRARKASGLSDLGKDFHDEPLERLLWSVNKEAELHPAGRFITRERLTGLLVTRLRAEEWFRRFPAILDQELYPASIIVGLQRTGTTKLHRLLAEDPDHRVIPSWEVIHPVPSPGTLPERGGAVTSRIRSANGALLAVRLMAPDFFAIHPIMVMEPEEDILLLDLSFLSTTPEAMMNVPSYASWLERTDQSEAYAYAVKILKFLQWQRPAKRWVLKSPHHLEFPGLIGKHFNQVEFIWPHRSLYKSVPSFLSMVTCNHMIFSNQTDLTRIASHWVRKTGYMLDRALEYRQRDGNASRFIDIRYEDLVRNSMKELDRIYHRNGGMTQELEARFRRHEKEHPPKKYGAHHYSLSDFGLTEEDIDLYTRNYREFMTSQYGTTP